MDRNVGVCLLAVLQRSYKLDGPLSCLFRHLVQLKQKVDRVCVWLRVKLALLRPLSIHRMPVDFDIGHFSHISRLSSSIPLERLLLPQVDRSSARLVPPGKLPLLSLPSSTMAAKPAASETLPSQVSVDQQYFKGVAAISLFGKTGESGEEMGIPGQRKKAETVLQQVEKCFVTSGRIDR